MAASLKIAIATSHEFPELTAQERGLPRALEARGTRAEIVIWNRVTPQELKARGFLVVWLRSVWDCWEHSTQFLEWCNQVEQVGLKLVNPFSIVQWNANKEYLRDLERRGIPIVPTKFVSVAEVSRFVANRGASTARPDAGTARGGARPGDDLGATSTQAPPQADSSAKGGALGLGREYEQGFVLKPTVSSSGNDTYKIESVAEWTEKRHEVETSLAKKADCLWMLQPFLKDLAREGEASVFFLNDQKIGKITQFHAVLKKAAPGEFLVQPERGGSFTRIDADPAYTPALVAAKKVAENLPPGWIYARIDLVQAESPNPLPSSDGERSRSQPLADGAGQSKTWCLSEAELIEPNLFVGVSDPHFVAELARLVCGG